MKLKRAWFSGVFSLIFGLGALSLPPLPALAGGNTSTVSVDVTTVVNADFLGIGAEYDPFHFMPESLENGYNGHWWELEKRRLAKLKPNVVRVWYQIDWMEPVNDNQDPHVIDWEGMQTDSVKMQAVYRVLDELKSQQIDVNLVAGWKMTEEVQSWLGFDGLAKPETSAPTDLEEWAEWVSATLQQLIVHKGYDNIKYVTSYNEPNLGDFETPAHIDQMAYYEAMYRAIHERLVADGLRSQIKLLGPDESGGLPWMQYAAEQMNDILDIYEGHAYGHNYTTLADWTSDRMAYVQPTGKPLMITEIAAPGDKTTPQNAIELADLMVSGMRSGVSGILVWRLADQYLVDPLNFLDSAEFGTWVWPENSAVPRHTYYTFGLFSRFTGAHSQVLLTESDDPDLHVTSVKRPDGEYSVFVVNKSSSSKQVSLQFSEPLHKPFHRHVYTDELQPTAGGLVIPGDRSWNPISVSLDDFDVPANSVALYTTVPEPIQLKITPAEVSAVPGATIDFNGELIGASGKIKWSVVGSPAYGTIDAQGRYTAPTTLPPMSQALVRAQRAGSPDDYDLAVIRFEVMGLSALGDDGTIELNWSPAEGATGYHVRRSTTPAGPYVTIAGQVTDTTYTDTAVSNGVSYYYTVSAIGSSGEGLASKPVEAMPTSNTLQDDFDDGVIDLNHWSVIDRGLRSSQPTDITATEAEGVLTFEGTTGVNYWSGKALESVQPFHASASKPLVVEVERVSLEGNGTGLRSGLWLYVSPSEYLRFSQNKDTGVWAYNLNGGSDTLVYANNDGGTHTMKLVHNGTEIQIYVDDVMYSSVPVTWSSNMRVVLSAEARASGDSIRVQFDRLSVNASEPE